MSQEIRCSIYIEASPEKVWRAVESQDMLRKWMGGSVEYEPVLGGRVRIYGRDDQGTNYVMGGSVITWDVYRKMQFNWEGYEPEPYSATLFTFELQQEGTGTRVTIVHNQFEDEKMYLSFKEGWGGIEKTMQKIADIALSA
jgi:uncharacterized protein YndB with AHSA1/START domain